MGMTFEALTGVLAMKVADWTKGTQQASSDLKKLAKDTETATSSMDKQVSQKTASIRDQFNTIVSEAKKVGGAIGGFVKDLGTMGAAVAATASATSVKLLSMAAAAEEAGVKFRFVFKSSADLAGRSLDTFAGKVGRSSLMLRNMASDFGSMLTPMGLSVRQSREMSTALSKLSVDMAAFFGVSESEAMSALQAGLAGQTRALKHFGVVIHEEDIANKAMQMGLIQTADDLTASTRAIALYNLVMHQTGLIQGHAERTAGNYNNQLTRLFGTFKALNTAAGMVLLPMAGQSLKLLNGIVAPLKDVAARIKEFAKNNQEALRNKANQFWLELADGVDKVWAAGQRVAGWFSWVPAAINTVTQAVVGLANTGRTMFGMLPQWAQDLLLVAGAAQGTWLILNRFGALVSWIPGLGGLVSMLIGMVNPLKLLTGGWGLLKALFIPLLPMLKMLGVALMGMSWPVTAVVLGVSALVAALVYAYRSSAPFKKMVDTIAGALGGALLTAVTWAGEKLVWLGGLFADYLLPAIKVAADWIGTNFFVVLEKAQGWFTAIGRSITEVATILTDTFVGAVNEVRAAIGLMIDMYATMLRKMADGAEKVPGMGKHVAAAWRAQADMLTGSKNTPDDKPNAANSPAVKAATAAAESKIDKAKKESSSSSSDAHGGADGGADSSDAAQAAAKASAAVDVAEFEKKIRRTQKAHEATRRRMAVVRGAIDHIDTGGQDVQPGVGAEGIDATAFRSMAAQKAQASSRDELFAELEKLEEADKRMAEGLEKKYQQLDDVREGRTTVAEVTGANKGKKPGSGSAEGDTAGGAAGGLGAALRNLINAKPKKPVAGTDIAGDDQQAFLQKASFSDIKKEASKQAKAMRESMADMQKSGNATRPELQELAFLKQQAVEATAAIAGTYGEQRDAAIKAAADAQGAYKKAYEEIEERGKKTFAQLRNEQKKNAEESKKSGEKMAKEGGASGGAGAGSGGAGGKPGSSPQGMVMGAGGQMMTAAEFRSTNQSGAVMTGALAGMAQGMSAGFNSALEGVGGGVASFMNFLDSIKDPIAKLKVQIQTQQALVASLRANKSGAGMGWGSGPVNVFGLAEAEKELKNLEGQRQHLLHQMDEDRHSAEAARRADEQHQKMAREEEDRDHRREQNLDFAGMIAVGKVPPVVLNINGVNDVRQAVDNLEKELRRRGFNRGLKRTLETTTPGAVDYNSVR